MICSDECLSIISLAVEWNWIRNQGNGESGGEYFRIYHNSYARPQVPNKLTVTWLEKTDGLRRYLGTKRNGLGN